MSGTELIGEDGAGDMAEDAALPVGLDATDPDCRGVGDNSRGSIGPPPTCGLPDISTSLSESSESSCGRVLEPFGGGGLTAGGLATGDGPADGADPDGLVIPSVGPSPMPSPRPRRATIRPSFASSSFVALFLAALCMITESQGCCVAA